MRSGFGVQRLCAVLSVVAAAPLAADSLSGLLPPNGELDRRTAVRDVDPAAQGNDAAADKAVVVPNATDPENLDGAVQLYRNPWTNPANPWGGYSDPPASYSVGRLPIAVDIGDLDNDKDLDLVVLNQADETFTVLLSEAHDGAYKSPTVDGEVDLDIGSGDVASDLTVADFNDDGFDDVAVVVTANGAASRVLVFFNQTQTAGSWAGMSKHGQDFAVANNGLARLVVRGHVDEGSFDDGCMDLTLYDPKSRYLSAMTNDGMGGGAWQGFTAASFGTLAGKRILSRVCDATGNGATDLVTVDMATGDPEVHENVGDDDNDGDVDFDPAPF